MKKYALACLAMLLLAGSTRAGDWPRLLGPDGNNISKETGLAKTWPASGPKVLWTIPVGTGFGSATIENGKVYFLDRVDDKQDVLRCLNLDTSKEEWKFEFDAPASWSMGHPGSRNVVTIDKDAIYFCGTAGDVYAIDKQTHKPLWQKSLPKDFGSQPDAWNFSQAPFIYKDTVIVAPVSSTAGVVALNKKTGEVAWKSEPLSGGLGHASPIVTTIDGVDQVIMVVSSSGGGGGGRNRGQGGPGGRMGGQGGPGAPGGRAGGQGGPNAQGGQGGPGAAGGNPSGGAAGVDASNGKILWTYYGKWRCQIPIPSAQPVGDGRVIITGEYGAGTAMLKIKKNGDAFTAEELYLTKDCQAQLHQPLLMGNVFYANGNGNSQSKGLLCMDLDGKLLWSTGEKKFGLGPLMLADGMIYMIEGEKGDLVMIKPNPEKYEEVARASLLSGKEIWGEMALSNGKLIIRDQTQMKCVDLKNVK
jgi:outer membrane protein assembly factor BamB